MTETNRTRQVVERIVAQTLERHLPRLQEQLVNAILEQFANSPTGTPTASPDGLLEAVAAIHAANTQRDILRILLDHASRHCGRTALFVVKSGQVTGWQGRAFAHPEAIKDFPLDASCGAVAEALAAHKAVTFSASEMDPRFIRDFQAPKDNQCVLLPLMLREKVAALLYADGGLENRHLDAPALALLVLSTGTWLEVTSLRKSPPREGAAETGVGEPPLAKAAAAHAGPAVADPFAAHAPAFAQPRSATAGKDHPPRAEAALAPEPGAQSLAGMSAEEADIHRKAHRFARLLVDEIKLYNQAKVMEGRKNRDLYDRLKEDIDKSRASYQKRYGHTVAASGDYINQEIIRSLAEDDVSLLGGNFKR